MSGADVDKIIQEAPNLQEAICQITGIAAHEMSEAGVPMDWINTKSGAKAFADAATTFIYAGECLLTKHYLEKARKEKDVKR